MNTKKIRREVILYLVIMAVGQWVLIELDAFEVFYDFSRSHEDWELDDIILIIPIAMVCMGIFSFMRFREARRHSEELEKSRRQLAEANEQMARVMRSKEEFMAVACHELKSPLSGIASSLQLYELADNEEERHEAVTLAADAARNMGTLVDDVLAFSRMGTAEQEPLVKFDLPSLMESIERFGELEATEKGLGFEVVKNADVPASLFGCEGALRLVVLNLVGNAVKYTESGTVSVDYKHRDTTRSELVVTVSDTGVGIPENEQHSIFEPYRKGDGAYEAKSGLGLGLSIVKRLVEQQDGAIHVESEPGRGSAFTVVMPVSVVS